MADILLVEDNSINRMIIQDIFDFDSVPAELVPVETGEEALVVAEQRQPLLILLDIRLPGMDGLEVARSLKSNPNTNHIPIWGISAQAMDGDREKAMSAGFQRYFTKPINSSELSQELRDALVAPAQQLSSNS